MQMENKKKTWTELAAEVKACRRRFAGTGLITRFPQSFTFRKLNGKTRIYFMSSLPDSRENSIFAIDIPEHSNDSPPEPSTSNSFPWIQIVASSNIGAANPPSKEEQLMMERKRMSPKGILDYEFDKISSKFVISAGSSLYENCDNIGTSISMSPIEIKQSKSEGARLNPEICPNNPNLIAFINNFDIWVVNTFSGHEERLTNSNGRLTCGYPSYVMQEEFNRYSGYWWQPHQLSVNDGVYKILYEEVDESEVNLVRLLTLPELEPEEFRFPLPGSKNASSTLRIIEFFLDGGSIVVKKNYPLHITIKELFPWAEYIVRMDWTPSGKFIWAQILDRKQQRLELVIYPYINSINEIQKESLPSAPAYCIYSEKTNIWINVNDILTFLPSSIDEDSISFIWASEETGFRHLYFIKSELRPSISKPWYSTSKPVLPLSPLIICKIPLTAGEWEVVNEPIRIRFPEGIVFFSGLCETPLEKQIYAVSIDHPGKLRRITQLGYSHTAVYDSTCSLVVITSSNIKEPPSCKVFALHFEGSNVEKMITQPIAVILDQKIPLDSILSNFSIPEIQSYRLQSTGQEIYSMVFKPLTFDPSKIYPTILHIYGGPEVQLIHNTFKGSGQLWIHLLASQGYVVISIDSRGSSNRGLEFASHINKRMGTVELDDQVEVLEKLVNERPYIDQSRIGIYGWSYGGYLSLLGIALYPHIFKLSVAGAPVTCWDLYDTGYTEKYMSIPTENYTGYKLGSILNYIEKFPDSEDRLLIIHGLVDENVHFVHTAKLIDSLIRAGKPYSLQLYPNERHSLRRLEASEHFETTLLNFLNKNL